MVRYGSVPFLFGSPMRSRYDHLCSFVWTMVELDGSGSLFSPAFRNVFPYSASPRTLKVLDAAGVPLPLLCNEQLPELPDLK